MATKNLVVRFLGRDSSLQAAFRRTRRAFRTLGRATRLLRTGLKNIALAGVVAGAGLLYLAKRSIDGIDNLSKMAERLNTTSGEIQLLQHAAELGGGSLASFAKLISKVGQVVGKQFISPTKETTDVLDALGVSLDSLKGLGAVESFKKLLPLVLKLNETQQRAAGQALFGRQFSDQLPALKNFVANMERAQKVLGDTGLLLSPTGAQSIVDLKDNLTDISSIVDAFSKKFTEALGPTLNTLFGQLSAATQQWLKDMGGGEKAARLMATSVLQAVPGIIDAFKELSIVLGGIVAAMKAIGSFGGKIVDAVGVSAKIATGQTDIQRAPGEALGQGLDFLSELFSKVLTENQEQTRVLTGGFNALGKAL